MADDVLQVAKEQLLDKARDAGKIIQKDIFEIIPDTKENALPSRPARPVRPIRCT